MMTLHSRRAARVMEKLRALSLTQTLVTDPRSIFYLTGLECEPYERMLALYLNVSRPPILFANRLFNIPETDIEVVRYDDTEDPVRMLAGRVDAEKPLGIDKEWTARFLIPLMEICPAMAVRLASSAVDDCRAVKDAEETALMREASRINDLVMERAAARLRPGMTEKELAAFIEEAYLQEGCSGASFSTIVSFGAHAADPHHEPDDTPLTPDVCVLIDMGCRKGGYCSDMTRTFFYGKPDETFLHVHDLVHRANLAAEAIIRPGVRLCDVDRAARSVIAEAGYGEAFNHRLGHFIGQTDHEKGDVSAVSEIIAAPGMIFSIEPGIYLENRYGVRIEDLVLVTPTGCEVLNRVEKGLRFVCEGNEA